MKSRESSNPSAKPTYSKKSDLKAFDSDDHDDFNPINDLMPPSIAGSDNIDTIGKKRARENDPLRRLMEESSADDLSKDAADAPTKRPKVVSNER
jgi:hypothetical protein